MGGLPLKSENKASRVKTSRLSKLTSNRFPSEGFSSSFTTILGSLARSSSQLTKASITAGHSWLRPLREGGEGGLHRFTRKGVVIMSLI